VAGAVLGVTVIFLTQVRSSLVVLLGAVVVYLMILIAQRRTGTAMLLALVMGSCGVLSLGYAASLGGKSVINRFSTLIEDDPMAVYDQSARMGMVAETFHTHLVEHPFGAGLGRWGMMLDYFGDKNSPIAPMIWAEVQFASWVLDGGVVLLTLYTLAILLAVRRLMQLSLRLDSESTGRWAAAIAMLSAIPIMLTFSYCSFNAQMGMQFWFLIGAIEGVAQGQGGSTGPPGMAPPGSRRRLAGAGKAQRS
jgi:hypothetical protein